jgi:hypothetical protein
MDDFAPTEVGSNFQDDLASYARGFIYEVVKIKKKKGRLWGVDKCKAV